MLTSRTELYRTHMPHAFIHYHFSGYGWKEWGEWSVCSSSCGGNRWRVRQCYSNETNLCEGDSIETESCSSMSAEECESVLSVNGKSVNLRDNGSRLHCFMFLFLCVIDWPRGKALLLQQGTQWFSFVKDVRSSFIFSSFCCHRMWILLECALDVLFSRVFISGLLCC